ncbi:MAG: hypothetical protein U5P10_14140 [Spirochaetia bacterium]|nr:hypothetical protein [Spirochaetia bacterium]
MSTQQQQAARSSLQIGKKAFLSAIIASDYFSYHLVFSCYLIIHSTISTLLKAALRIVIPYV